jgi:hypothetical protein
MKGIIFDAESVTAILDSRKTQTRRVITKVNGLGPVTEFGPSDTPGYDWIMRDKQLRWNDLRHAELIERCPLGKPGELVYVKEAFFDHSPLEGVERDPELVEYRATPWERKGDTYAGGWRSSLHMPEWASRIKLHITDIRAERLHDITEDDAYAEGITYAIDGGHTAAEGFQRRWDSINAKRGHPWASNPWVWVITFERTDMKEAA